MSETADTTAVLGAKDIPIYNAMMLEIERRRLAVGISMDRMSELTGLAERAYSKMLYADTSSGRLARWETMQMVMSVLFCDGFQLRIEPKPENMLSTLSMAGVKRKVKAEAATWHRPVRRVLMRELGSKGGGVRADRLTPERRAEIARQGAAARWARPVESGAGA